jgi:hypothetical protein
MKDSKFTRMLRNLREKMKPMTLPQKIGYLWFVFKDYALVASAVVILLGAAIVSGINMNIETLIAGVSVNVPMNDFGVAYLSDDYGKVLGAVENKAEVTFITTQVASSDSSGNMEYNHNVIAQLVAQAAAGSLDYVIMSKDAMEILFSEDMFLDLREIMTDEELRQWEDKIVYLVIEEGGEEVPVALDLKGTSFSDDCISRRNSYFLGFVKTTPRKEACKALLAYLLAWDDRNK